MNGPACCRAPCRRASSSGSRSPRYVHVELGAAARHPDVQRKHVVMLTGKNFVADFSRSGRGACRRAGRRRDWHSPPPFSDRIGRDHFARDTVGADENAPASAKSARPIVCPAGTRTSPRLSVSLRASVMIAIVPTGWRTPINRTEGLSTAKASDEPEMCFDLLRRDDLRPPADASAVSGCHGVKGIDTFIAPEIPGGVGEGADTACTSTP